MHRLLICINEESFELKFIDILPLLWRKRLCIIDQPLEVNTAIRLISEIASEEVVNFLVEELEKEIPEV